MMRRILYAAGLLACVAPVMFAGQVARPEGVGTAPDVKVTKHDYDMKGLIKTYEAPLSDDVRKGRNIWLQRCAYCHDGLGTPTYNTFGPYLDAELINKRGDGPVRDKIAKGSAMMPGFQWGLKPAQIDQVIAFMKTIGPDQKPTDAQKAGKAIDRGDL